MIGLNTLIENRNMYISYQTILLELNDVIVEEENSVWLRSDEMMKLRGSG